MYRNDRVVHVYDPELLRTFLAVAQSLCFTRSGAGLSLSQPTVSQHVRRLEQAVGRPLFVRDTRSVTLTADGEAMAGFVGMPAFRVGRGAVASRTMDPAGAAVRRVAGVAARIARSVPRACMRR